MEYLVTMTTHVPDGTPDQAVDDVRAREAAPRANWRRRAPAAPVAPAAAAG
jgi:Muconolactone delta-isomerase